MKMVEWAYRAAFEAPASDKAGKKFLLFAAAFFILHVVIAVCRGAL